MLFLKKRPLRREIDQPQSSGVFVSKRVSGCLRRCAPGPDALIPSAGGRPSWSPIRREPRELRQDNLPYRSVTRPAFGENPTAKSSTGKAPQGVVRKCGVHRGVGAGEGRSHVEDCRPSMRAQPKAARVGKHLSHSIPRVSYFAGGNLPSAAWKVSRGQSKSDCPYCDGPERRRAVLTQVIRHMMRVTNAGVTCRLRG